MVFVVACVLAVASLSTSASGQNVSDGISASAEEGEVNLWAWIQVEASSGKTVDPSSTQQKRLCRYKQGSLSELLAWMKADLGIIPDDNEVYVFKFCQRDGRQQLVKYWVYRPQTQQASASSGDVINHRKDVWGGLSISVPTILMAPSRVTIVHIPTFVWVLPVDRVPVSNTITTTLEGNQIRLTAIASPRFKRFLRVDMGDGNVLWCDAHQVMAFDIEQDPFDQLSKCAYFYRRSSVDAPDLRYQVVLTAYWEVVVRCDFNGRACSGPLPVVPVQALVAEPHGIGVAEIQALGGPSSSTPSV